MRERIGSQQRGGVMGRAGCFSSTWLRVAGHFPNPMHLRSFILDCPTLAAGLRPVDAEDCYEAE